MVKKAIPKKVAEEIERYVKVLKEDNLPISRVVLFGSYAKGTQKNGAILIFALFLQNLKMPL